MVRKLSILALALTLAACAPRENRIVVGSKNFTEQLILGEIISQQIEAKTHLAVERRFYLAGSYICHQAILGGRIDIYPEYTGTALTAILKQKPEGNREAVYQRVKSEYAQRFNRSEEHTSELQSQSNLVCRLLLEKKKKKKKEKAQNITKQ